MNNGVFNGEIGDWYEQIVKKKKEKRKALLYKAKYD